MPKISQSILVDNYILETVISVQTPHRFSFALLLQTQYTLLPPAYVVRREGNSFTLLVCSHPGGVPISHNVLQHFPECHGAAGGGGVPCQVQPGGYPGQGGYPGRGGTLAGGVPCLGGYPGGGVPRSGTPLPRPGQLGGGGGVPRSGQHREYLLHGGQYASCVHAGGLSCYVYCI